MIHRRPVVIANEIRMKRSQFAGAFLVVEGRDDRLLMEKFASPDTCKIVVAEGKQNVCEVIHILDDAGFAGVLGLVDSDFDRVEGKGITGLNIVKPEFHDLETMLLCSPALGRVLGEVGSQSKIEAFQRPVLNELLARALPIGHLRLYSIKAGLNLRFQGLRYSSWVNRTSFEASVSDLIEAVKNHSQRLDLPSEVLAAGIQELANVRFEPREICAGVDLVEILSVGLRRLLGTNDSSPVTSAELRRYLRLSYSQQDFAASDLCKEIRGWEARNGRFQLLRDVKGRR